MFSPRFFGTLRDRDPHQQGNQVSITIPCELRYRDPVGALLLSVCQQLEQNGAETGLGIQVVSAFNEAFNNLTQYAYDPPTSGVVDVELTIADGELSLSLLDSGNTFDLDTVQDPDLNELPETGLGIFIIRSFMTDVSYEPGSGGRKNRLRMVRRLDTPMADDAARND
jgi:serine/threonine-protein kinase RsbW